MKKTVYVLLLASTSALALVSTVASVAFWNRMRALERHAVENAQKEQKPEAKPETKTEKGPDKEKPSAHITDFQFDGSAIEMRFDRQPEAGDVLRYVWISPKVEEISVECRQCRWWGVTNWTVRLASPDFRYRTQYTMVVKREMPFADGCELKQDFRRTFMRPDEIPAARFADSGRYLPPVGEKTLAVETVNISNLACFARYVPPENIVQLLARDERKYGWLMSADGEDTVEISSAPVRWTETVPCPPNERTRIAISPRFESGIVSNGTYLVSVDDAARCGERESGHADFRLVCMTDLGLSVRCDAKSVRVWVVSLTTGRPVEGAKLELYSSSRVPLAAGETGVNGEATLEIADGRYEPFALIARDAGGTDVAFMALGNSTALDEKGSRRPDYLKAGECAAFVWTDRGIYRHGEKIMVHAILRDGTGNAPEPFPVTLYLKGADGRRVAEANAVCDRFGAVAHDGFFAPDGLPSGTWTVGVSTPGKDGKELGSRRIEIEEFAPPQIRVSLEDLPEDGACVTDIVYKVAAENLFGGAARNLAAESLVSFADAGFEPPGREGFRFGDHRRGIGQRYVKLPSRPTDGNGEARFSTGIDCIEWGLPKAAVRVTIQGAVCETGGRPAYVRASRVVHAYPYYLGSDVPERVERRPGGAKFKVVQVSPGGAMHREARKLKASLWKIEYVHSLSKNRNGSYSWSSERIRRPVECAASVEIGEDGEGEVEIPLSGTGDFEFTVEDAERGLSHCAPFWVSAGGDDELRLDLKNPSSVAIVPDKAVYREGDVPRLTVKSPFRGFARFEVMRENTLYTKTLEITNLTSVIELEPLDGAWAPNVDVAASVVQALEAGGGHLAARAHGTATLRIRTRDSELPVEIGARLDLSDSGGGDLKVKVVSRGEVAAGERAVVTVVDEGINLLTSERVPDPAGFFASERGANHRFHDIYNRLFPVCDLGLNAGGVKTGGDDMAGLMNRVSPVPSRRFKPLGTWMLDIPLENGEGTAQFKLPEFAGEVRITAFAYSSRGTGCAAIRQTVCPKLLMRPDAPRFAAPDDRFRLTLALFNRSGEDAEVEYEISAGGAVRMDGLAAGRVDIVNDGCETLFFDASALKTAGIGKIVFRASGCGETHSETIELPVRPAAAWTQSASVAVLGRGGKTLSRNPSASMPELSRRSFSVFSSPVAELVSAFDYLAEYPYGCLEQTTSRIFPLISGGGFLKLLDSSSTSKAEELDDIVDAGVARVSSMLGRKGFSIWPDVDCQPSLDSEIPLYAAHFLVEAEAAGRKVDAKVSARVRALLAEWAFDRSTDVDAYACHTLALAGCPENDRMFTLYDMREKLSPLSRARLSRAFARTGDPKRARELVSGAALAPASVKEAAFALVALLELDSKDERIAPLVLYLQKKRDRERFHWGTTCDNAHALMALGAYYRAAGIAGGKSSVALSPENGARRMLEPGETAKIDGGGDIAVENEGDGEVFVSMKAMHIPDQSAAVHNLINISRRFLTADGLDADMGGISRGDVLVAEISLSSDVDFRYEDLVVQDLFPACFEPDRKAVAALAGGAGRPAGGGADWVLRSDMRDDRIIVFSKPVSISADGSSNAVFRYAARAVSAGDFVLPGASVEAMYAPEIHARTASERIRVKP
ncbi:MAG: hypothetical protein ILO34_00040 [Kiritimatiellae bacterium]|nr:hypothetical protein [Kiritimatiellia bacterium]